MFSQGSFLTNQKYIYLQNGLLIQLNKGLFRSGMMHFSQSKNARLLNSIFTAIHCVSRCSLN